jgi:uncharacterized protein YkwD
MQASIYRWLSTSTIFERFLTDRTGIFGHLIIFKTIMNWVDLVLILVILLSIYSGWRRGIILSFIDLVRWIGSWLAALFLYQYVSAALARIFDLSETWRNPLSFLLVLAVTSLIIHTIGWSLARRIPRSRHESSTNRVLGTIPGAINGIVMAAILSAVFFAMPLSDGLSQSLQESVVANRLALYTDEIQDALVPIFDPAIRQTLNRLITTEPGSSETVELPFKVENSKPNPVLETQMLELVNQERVSRGLKPLEADPELTEVARKHSADMFARGYFSHYTPEGEDPFARMKDAGVKFRIAGENLALAPTLQIAHTGLMNSPGHRANILRPQFGRVGIGIMDGGRRGIMVSQEFRN